MLDTMSGGSPLQKLSKMITRLEEMSLEDQVLTSYVYVIKTRSAQLVRVLEDIGANVEERTHADIQDLYFDTDREKINDLCQLFDDAESLYKKDSDLVSIYSNFVNIAKRWEDYLVDTLDMFNSKKEKAPGSESWSHIKTSIDRGSLSSQNHNT